MIMIKSYYIHMVFYKVNMKLQEYIVIFIKVIKNHDKYEFKY